MDDPKWLAEMVKQGNVDASLVVGMMRLLADACETAAWSLGEQCDCWDQDDCCPTCAGRRPLAAALTAYESGKLPSTRRKR